MYFGEIAPVNIVSVSCCSPFISWKLFQILYFLESVTLKNVAYVLIEAYKTCS